jgi:hypothetical protein
VRWGSLFAIGFCLLLFANWTGNITSSPTAQVSNAIQDPTRFWTLRAGVLAPMVVALLMPAVLTSVAERLASARPEAARRFGWLAIGSMAAVVAAALLTVVVGFFFGCPPATSAARASARRALAPS